MATVVAAVFAAIVAAAPAAGAGGSGAKDNDINVQLLAINDFHGHIEPNTPGSIQIGQTRNPTTGAVVNQFVPAGEPILPAYEIRKVGGAKIAFIGLTLEGTPLIVTPSAIAGLEFRDEVQTVNALVRKLRNENGVRTFVILLHQGGFQNAPFSTRRMASPDGPASTTATTWAARSSTLRTA